MIAIDATACATLLKIKIQLLGVIIFAIIGSGVMGNFMSDKFAKNHQIPGLAKEKPYKLMVIDETLLSQDEEMVKKKTLLLRTQINGKNVRQTIFDLVIIPHKVILGILRLEITNPSIDWYTQRITLRGKNFRKPIF